MTPFLAGYIYLDNSYFDKNIFIKKVSHHGRNETATSATPLYNRAGPNIENNMVPLQFSKDKEF
jgi:hypothetical protein